MCSAVKAETASAASFHATTSDGFSDNLSAAAAQKLTADVTHFKTLRTTITTTVLSTPSSSRSSKFRKVY
jgi:hypothetical protein